MQKVVHTEARLGVNPNLQFMLSAFPLGVYNVVLSCVSVSESLNLRPLSFKHSFLSKEKQSTKICLLSTGF